jgi:hypothetical protein
MKRFSRKSFVIIVLLSLAVIITGIGAAAANGAQVTRGDVHTFAVGLTRGYDISGHAQMVRTADGRTITFVEAWGLAPNTSYPSHVHNMPCAVLFAGGHYQNVVGGPADNVNEIWLSFTTDASGHGNGHATNDFTARPEAQSVVIHDVDTQRIACADLQ